MFFKRRGKKENGGATAVAEPPVLGDPTEFDGTTDELFAEITRLTEENRDDRDRERERRILRLRHLAGARLLDADTGAHDYAQPDFSLLPDVDGLPEFNAADVTPELLRAGILRNGCVLARGLVPRDDALRFADQIDRAFVERDRFVDEGADPAEGYYEEFDPHPRFGPYTGRQWIKLGGGVLAGDSPMLLFEMMELFAAANLRELVAGYLGEPPTISLHKTTLRKADPSVGGAWHQDGAFMGQVRSLNLWLALSRCGDESPGLDIVPKRLEHLVATQTEEAMLSYQVSQTKAEEAAVENGTKIIRPIFEPGDALFFDHLFLHQTGSDPSMPRPRYAVENWFFAGSAFPDDFAPIAV